MYKTLTGRVDSIVNNVEAYAIPDMGFNQAISIRERLDQLGIKVFDLNNKILRDLYNKLAGWKEENENKINLLGAIKLLIVKKTSGLDPNLAAVERYKVEYATASELEIYFIEAGIEIDFQSLHESFKDKINYDYWTATLDSSLLQIITGVSLTNMLNMKIADIGAGSGNLIKTLINLGIKKENITAVDISPTSSNTTRGLGVESLTGRLQDIQLSGVDLVFLSYFIDRDLNQEETFNESLKALNEEGIIVLEGLLPALPVDPSGISYAELGLVTKGKSVEEDLELIIDRYFELAKNQGIQIVATKVFSSLRLVYSRDGFELLPSYFLVIKRLQNES